MSVKSIIETKSKFGCNLSKPNRGNRDLRSHCVYNSLVVIFLLVLVTDHLVPHVFGVPLTVQVPDAKVDAGENSLTTTNGFTRTQQSRIPYCRYKSGTFSLGDEVQTEEPCLKCHCQRTAVVCKLRMCRDMPDAPPPGCIVVHKAKKCCAELICPDGNRKNSREQRLSAAVLANTSLMLPQVTGEKGFCIHEGTVYAEGSAMQASSLCEYCFCIRGEMKCSSPQCLIPLNGCKPKFRSYACCPTNYDCNESNATAILKTIPTSTAIPKFLKGCQVQGRFIQDGEPVLPMQLEMGEGKNRTNLCQTCFCMGGLVRCRPLECDRPLDGCLPITPDGHCCPDRYDCGNGTTWVDTPPTAPTARLSSGSKSKEKDGKVESSSTSATLILEDKSNKNKSEVGSREQRRNRDKDDFAIGLKTSFEHEDDKNNAREESLSFEHGEHDQASSVSFEGTSEQGSSNFDSDAILDLEPASETETPETSSSEDNSASIIVTESENELEDVTTTVQPTTVTTSPTTETNVTVTTKTVTVSTTTASPTSTTTPEEPSPTSSDTESTSPDLVSASSNISYPESTSTSVSPEEMTTVDPGIVEFATSSPTSTTTLNNLHFIPFGVEDAVVGDPNAVTDFEPSFPKYDTKDPPPIKIVYDQNALRTSLIQPTPPKGYVHVPLKTEPLREAEPFKNPTITIPSTDTFKDELISMNQNQNQNSMIDIPVSTSLYNNGYFSNGIPPPANLTGFPGQVFEDSGDGVREEDGIIVTHSDPPIKINFTASEAINESSSNPLRTYSKFGVQDTPFYRYGLEPGHPEQIHKPDDIPAARDDDNTSPWMRPVDTPGFNPYADYEQEDVYDDSFEKGIQQEQKLLNAYRFENYDGSAVVPSTTTMAPTVRTTKPTTTLRPETTTTILPIRNKSKTKSPTTMNGGFKPVVAFPFMIPKNKPLDSLFNIGLKLSGCNIYGKMYRVGMVIVELSTPCLLCECNEVGVQCTELPCRNGNT